MGKGTERRCQTGLVKNFHQPMIFGLFCSKDRDSCGAVRAAAAVMRDQRVGRAKTEKGQDVWRDPCQSGADLFGGG